MKTIRRTSMMGFMPDALRRLLGQVSPMLSDEPQSQNGETGGNGSGAQDGDLTRLADALNALATHHQSDKLDAVQEAFLRQYGVMLGRMGAEMEKVAGAVHALSRIEVQVAADIDPEEARRILGRMRKLGDATLRQIEVRISTSASREQRKELQTLRDDLRAWLEQRDLQLEATQTTVDELHLRANALRQESVARSGRLAKAAVMTVRAAGTRERGSLLVQRRHISPEAVAFSERLRALLRI